MRYLIGGDFMDKYIVYLYFLSYSICWAGEVNVEKKYEISPPFREFQGEVQNNNLVRERIVNWTRYELLSAHSIRLHFFAGTESCYGYRTVVQETEKSIGIALIRGGFKGGPRACTLEGRDAYFLIQTEKSIGGREIIPLKSVELKE